MMITISEFPIKPLTHAFSLVEERNGEDTYFARASWDVSQVLRSDEDLLAWKDEMLYTPCIRGTCEGQPWSTHKRQVWTELHTAS